MNKELKPCPFCGGKAYICTTFDERGLPSFTIFHEGLRDCHFWRFDVDPQTVKTKEEAAKAWNRRANDG